MGWRVEGDRGGIRGLRRLIEGEYAGAINYDLRSRGWPGVAWAGTVDLSWWDLLTFVTHVERDSSSALFRQIQGDDHVWSRPEVLLASAIANAVEDIKFLTAVPLFGEETPARYTASQYGPTEPEPFEQTSSDQTTEVDRDERAREGAAQIRAELGLLPRSHGDPDDDPDH